MNEFDLFDKTVDYIRSLPGSVQYDALYLISGDTEEFDINCAVESLDKFYQKKVAPLWLIHLSEGNKEMALIFLKTAIVEHKIPPLVQPEMFGVN